MKCMKSNGRYVGKSAIVQKFSFIFSLSLLIGFDFLALSLLCYIWSAIVLNYVVGIGFLYPERGILSFSGNSYHLERNVGDHIKCIYN